MSSAITNRTLAKIFGASLLINAFIVLAYYLSVAPIGTDFLLWFALFAILTIPVAFLALPVSLVLLFWKRHRVTTLKVFAICLIHLVVGVACFRIANDIRRNGFVGLTQRSRPLIQSIQQFEAKYGKPPEELEQLVPEFLPAVPTTGIGAHPNYQLIVPKNQTDYEGNAWVLRVSTPSGGINFDCFLYFPKQNYPRLGYGGVLERIEDWAYVHE